MRLHDDSIGAGELALVRKSFRPSVLLGSALAAFIALLFLAIPEVLTDLFTNDAAVLVYAEPLLMVGAAYQYCDAIAIVTDGALRGPATPGGPSWCEARSRGS